MTAKTQGSEYRERENKFDVPPGWQLPDPRPLARRGASIRSSVVELQSTYYDADDRSLFDNRVTLRRRTGAEDQGWQLKVPDGNARVEVRSSGTGRAVPKDILEMTRGLRRGAALGPVAILTTRRDVHEIVDRGGRTLAELVVDDVSAHVLGATTTATNWCEVEVELKCELGSEGDALLRHATKWLEKHGATVSQWSSKLARALGAEPSSPSYPTQTVLGSVLNYLDRQYEAIIYGDLAIRRGRNAVHKTRVATRRYRSTLRIFADLFDADRAAEIDAELRWYAGTLGDLRDLQVTRANLLADVAELPDDLVLGPVAANLQTTLDLDIAKAARRLDEAMRGKRYQALLADLKQWRLAAPVVQASGSGTKLRGYLVKAEEKYRKRLAAAELLDERDRAKNDAMHRARKAAKRARYTAEVSEPAIGKKARKARKRAKAVQSALGDRQDAVIAMRFLRSIGASAGTTSGHNGFTYGLLYARAMARGHLPLA